MTDLQRLKKVIYWLIFAGHATNERELAEKLGYTKSSFSQIVTGKVPLSDKFIQKLVSLDKNINKDWIKTGAGNLLKQDLYSDKMGSIRSAVVNEAAIPYYGKFQESPSFSEGNPQIEYYLNLINEKNKQIALLEKNITLLEKQIAILEKNADRLEKQIAKLENQVDNTLFTGSTPSKNDASSKGKTARNNARITTLG